MALFRAKCNTFARRRLHARLGNQRSPAPATLKASSSRVEIILHSVNLQSSLRTISVEIPAEKMPSYTIPDNEDLMAKLEHFSLLEEPFPPRFTFGVHWVSFRGDNLLLCSTG
ncbi:hypothetical protein CEXT_56561 [Caerostris extrusa]|uniref:Uncharacterized protein n=1 Tax=Caerostris extrusa TaxID=172846 RepID=A0AAV4UY28_CAEEX|nr:hypothetical protein CEXT_56561 [Caerostris extrusa]